VCRLISVPSKASIQEGFNDGSVTTVKDLLMLAFVTKSCSSLQANAQEKFLRIKHAYNTLMNSESRSKYASSSSSSSSSDSSWTPGSSKSADAEEQFYGFGTETPSLQLY
jgi:hypothetical protein